MRPLRCWDMSCCWLARPPGAVVLRLRRHGHRHACWSAGGGGERVYGRSSMSLRLVVRRGVVSREGERRASDVKEVWTGLSVVRWLAVQGEMRYTNRALARPVIEQFRRLVHARALRTHEMARRGGALALKPGSSSQRAPDRARPAPVPAKRPAASQPEPAARTTGRALIGTQPTNAVSRCCIMHHRVCATLSRLHHQAVEPSACSRPPSLRRCKKPSRQIHRRLPHTRTWPLGLRRGRAAACGPTSVARLGPSVEAAAVIGFPPFFEKPSDLHSNSPLPSDATTIAPSANHCAALPSLSPLRSPSSALLPEIRLPAVRACE